MSAPIQPGRQSAIPWPALLRFLLFFGVYCACSAHVLKVYEVTGDEPHYLLVAHSLAYDGDFNLTNNFQARDYEAFYSYELSPETDHQAIDFLGNGVLLSKHDMGLPLLIAPFYRVAGRWGVLVFQSFVTALTMTLCGKWVYAHTHSWTISLLTCLGIGWCIPTLAFSTQIYPEVEAALLVLWGLNQLDQTVHPRATGWRLVGVSTVIGLLPWLSIKYAAISIVLVASGVFLLHRSSGHNRLRSVAHLITPALLLGLLWTYVRIRFYGTLSPVAQYTGLQFELAHIDQRILGLFLDQEHGLLPYSPIYTLVPFGLAIMWRAGRRAITASIGMTFLAFFGLIAWWHCWWGGWCFPARFLATVLPILALPIGYVYKAVFRLRWALVPMMGLTIGLTALGILLGFFGLVDPAYRLLNRRDGVANLFMDLGPRKWDWPSVLPSYPPADSWVRFSAADAKGQVGQNIVDPNYGNGQARFAPIGNPAGYLVEGAYEMLASGRYRVCAEIRSGESAGVIGLLDAALPGRRPEQIFALPIEGPASTDVEYRRECGELWLNQRKLVEFRLWFTGVGDVYVRSLSYKRLGPWSPTLYTITDTLDFADADTMHYLGKGWSAAEPWGRWAIGRSSEIYIHLGDRVDTWLTMSVFPYRALDLTQQISVYYNDQLLGKFELPVAETQEVSVVIPQKMITRDVDVLRLDYGYARSPAEDKLSGDQRLLAVGFVTLRLGPLP